MKTLRLWNFYSRKDVHSIFSPDTNFTPQSGTWGLQGIIKVPGRDGDFVFFVTFGKSQGEHVFDESITADGVLSWQSQPSQGFDSDVIKSFIHHDERLNNIHLFLRAKSGEEYGYFGTLGYLTHDTQREKPVHFQWQLMDWAAPTEFLQAVGILPVLDAMPRLEAKEDKQKNVIEFVAPPSPRTRRNGTSTIEFQTRKSPNYVLRQESNSALGLLGEELVLKEEIKSLRNAGRNDLADKVVHVSVVEGDGAGHDIKSYTPDGQIKFIEVKSTKGNASAAFFISPNEVEFSRKNAKNFYLYRLYDLDSNTRSAKVYVLCGDLTNTLELRPTQFIAEIAGGNHE
jgi:Domain of unknown function (DUF3883)/Domain of unknown function (DUF3427)